MLLSLMQAGETVLVVSREESDWWRGEVDGRTGVFPSNYVQPAPCEYQLRITALEGFHQCWRIRIRGSGAF
jgi:hypothetical protein